MRGSDTAKTTVYYGNRYYHYKCAGVSVLEFDAGEGKEWKPETEGSPTLKATGTITVGGAIKIDGTVRISTTAGAQRVFVDVRIPAPGPEVLAIRFIGTALRFMQLSGYIPMTLGSSAASLLVNEDVGFAISTSVDVSQNPNDYIRAFGSMSLDFKYNNEVSFNTRVDTIATWVQPVRPPNDDDRHRKQQCLSIRLL